MNISYNWLKNYLKIDLVPEKVAEILTSIGLEVGSIERYQSVKGGLEGLVIGYVESCEKHANSDHLSVTKVNIGEPELLPIVCGASNVAKGQKVVVATVGTVLYNGDESFTIKKSKIRGEDSMGMICAEDEIGIGTSHDGIMVLPADTIIGTLAKDFFKVEDDVVFEVDLTPNRIDAASHIGIARDMAAFLKQTSEIAYQKPSVDAFKTDNNDLEIAVVVENTDACPRYAGVTLTNVKVGPSPAWLQNRLKAIGLSPINNVVDVTNFVLHETGQPLHAFDAQMITGNKVVVQTLPAKTTFVTLDEQKRELNENDLMICNANQGMCIAGVFGGLESGVSEKTTSVFLESAYFNPVFVRKTARRHILNTDASFRFERGIDPNGIIYALKRAALLIKEVAGANISSDIVDVYQKPFTDFEVELRFSQVKRLIGLDLNKDTIVKILDGLEIKVKQDKGASLLLAVPPYRVDVKREADVIEEILRIYGYNNVPVLNEVKSTLLYQAKPSKGKLQNIVSDQLSANGFNEIMSNSLTKQAYCESMADFDAAKTVKILNPLSQDLNGMRQSLLFGVLEAIIFNNNRQSSSLKLYEFGNCYFYNEDKAAGNPIKQYSQTEKIAIAVTGNRTDESWTLATQPVSFYYLKSQVNNLLERLGVDIKSLTITSVSNSVYSDALIYSLNNVELGVLGVADRKLLKQFDIKQPVYLAELNWEAILKSIKKHKIQFEELPKYPEVRRDLSLLLDKKVTFQQISDIAYKCEKKLLKDVSLFDVFEGEKLGADKKSYAVSFILQDETKTLNDKQIDKIIDKMIYLLTNEINAQVR